MTADARTCSLVQVRIPDHQQDQEVLRHLEECSECQHYAATLAQVLALAPTAGPAAPRELKDRLQESLHAPPIGASPAEVVRRPFVIQRRWRLRLAAAVSAVAVGLVAAIVVPQDSQRALLASAIRASAATPVTFSFVGSVSVIADESVVAPSATARRLSRDVVLVAAPGTTDIQAPDVPEIDLRPPNMDVPEPRLELPEIDVPRPVVPTSPVVPGWEMSTTLDELQADLARFGVDWSDADPGVALHYHGHGRSDGEGRVAYSVTIEASPGPRETMSVVSVGERTWVRSDEASPWIQGDAKVQLRVGPVTVPLSLTDMLEIIEQNVDAATWAGDAAGRGDGRYGVDAPGGHFDVLVRGQGFLDEIEWSTAARMQGDLRLGANLQLRVVPAGGVDIDLPQDVVPLRDLPIDARPPLLSP